MSHPSREFTSPASQTSRNWLRSCSWEKTLFPSNLITVIRSLFSSGFCWAWHRDNAPMKIIAAATTYFLKGKLQQNRYFRGPPKPDRHTKARPGGESVSAHRASD